MTDVSELITIFNQYTNSETPANGRHFNRIANQLWDQIESIALHISPQHAEEMTCVLMNRLYNRRQKPFQPVNTPKAYIITALKNIRTDIWRREKRRIGYQDHLGEFHYHQSLDAMSFDNSRSLHEQIADTDNQTDVTIDLESAVMSLVRTHLYEEEIQFVSHATKKGKATFLEFASLFQPFTLNQFTPSDQNEYKQFDRQRQKLLEYLEEQIAELPTECMTLIQVFLNNHDVASQRDAILKQSEQDSSINPEIISRQIDLQLVVRTLLLELQNRKLTAVTIDTLLHDPILRGLMLHCEYQIFRAEGFRTKRTKKSDPSQSLYFENV